MAKHVTDILAEKGVLTEAQVQTAREKARKERKNLDDVLYELGVSERDLVLAKSEALRIPVRFLGGERVPFEVLKNIPEDSARFYQVVPLAERGDARSRDGEPG